MLTADLVNARRRGNELFVKSLTDDDKARATDLASELIQVLASALGRSRDEIDAALACVEVVLREHRLKDGLAKLLDDRCTWGAESDLSPEVIRRELFLRATRARSSLVLGQRFDRASVLAEIAGEQGTTPASLEGALYADLRGASCLSAFDPISPRALVDAYEQGQAQAVLLRAVRIVVSVQCASAGAARALFRRLKFLGLLHTIVPRAPGYEITIDGPLSLFESVTKYGVKMAQILPILDGCESWNLEADIRWGKDRLPLTFRTEGGRRLATVDEAPLPDELAALVGRFEKLETGWRVAPGRVVLDLPGTGLSVPDLIFTRGKQKIYFEAMGYWSREAVFRRVDLVLRGLCEKILFAVSSRLRVSEDVLGEDASGALYVYKGAMSARAIASHIERLAER